VSPRPDRVLLVFLDGLGIGGADAEINPLVRARLPTLRALFDGKIPVFDPLGEPRAVRYGRGWVAADATLGVPGRPQSGTGQTALLTGENAPALFGRHFGPWVPTGLRELLARRNLLSRAAGAALRASFANAYPAGPHSRSSIGRRPAAPPLAAAAAGVLVRHEEALREGRAVASSITHESWQRHLPGIPAVTAAHAGATLARVSAEADLTLFAHYDTDLVGHRRDLAAAVAVLERVDGFLEGLLNALPAGTLLVIASDHGNVEDTSTGHTTNPVPVIASGPATEDVVRGVRSIADVTPVLLRLLNVD
jgi:2,3-bisphosphoglycerate-independent phosphoglycerate mutase